MFMSWNKFKILWVISSLTKYVGQTRKNKVELVEAS